MKCFRKNFNFGMLIDITSNEMFVAITNLNIESCFYSFIIKRYGYLSLEIVS